MSYDTFDVDDRWQKHMRDTYLRPFYEDVCVEGRYVHIEDDAETSCSMAIQKKLDVDSILQRPDKRSVCLSEKIVRFPCEDCGREPQESRCSLHVGEPHTALVLETWSNTNDDEPGWMWHSHADWLVYAQETKHGYLDTFLLEMRPLQRWFSDHYRDYPTTQTDQYNQTKSRVVGFEDLHDIEGMKIRRYHLQGDDYKGVSVVDGLGHFVDSETLEAELIE